MIATTQRAILFEGRKISLKIDILFFPVHKDFSLLEVSGIGDHKILEQLSIPVLVNNEAVGENLQDHIMILPCFVSFSFVLEEDVLLKIYLDSSGGCCYSGRPLARRANMASGLQCLQGK